MKTITDLKEMMAKVENIYNWHLSTYHAEKENMDPANIEKFNCLMFAISDAYEKLEKGVNGIW